MPEGSNRDEPYDQKLVVYVSRPMIDELNRRAGREGEEGESRGFVVRKAIRDFFRRHPMRESAS